MLHFNAGPRHKHKPYSLFYFGKLTFRQKTFHKIDLAPDWHVLLLLLWWALRWKIDLQDYFCKTSNWIFAPSTLLLKLHLTLDWAVSQPFRYLHTFGAQKLSEKEKLYRIGLTGQPTFFRNRVQIPAAEIIFFIKRQTVWLDLATFDHFGKYLNIFANIFKVNLVWGKVFNSHWHNLYAFGQFFTIWSPGHTERRSKFFKKTKKEVLLRCRLRIILLSPPLHAIVETSKTVNSFELNSFKNCLVLFWN